MKDKHKCKLGMLILWIVAVAVILIFNWEHAQQVLKGTLMLYWIYGNLAIMVVWFLFHAYVIKNVNITNIDCISNVNLALLVLTNLFGVFGGYCVYRDHVIILNAMDVLKYIILAMVVQKSIHLVVFVIVFAIAFIPFMLMRRYNPEGAKELINSIFENNDDEED